MPGITALPTPPARSDSANFASRGDAFLAALVTFATEANALAAAMGIVGPAPGVGIFTVVEAESGATMGYFIRTADGSSYTARLTNDAGNATVLRPGATGAAVKVNNAANDAENLTVTDAGLLLVNVTTGALHRIKRNVAEGSNILELIGAAQSGHFFSSVATQGWNVAAVAMALGVNSSTGRSLNAGGTINASGADYAEYERKADGCGPVAKGQIIGFDADGHVTGKWSAAISFGVKSTNPTLVGGDTWGSQEALGMAQPQPPALPNLPYEGAEHPEDPGNDATPEAREAYIGALTQWQDDQDAYALAAAAALRHHHEVEIPEYLAAKAVFDPLLEAARQKVDRIAYSGKCPVNVMGASPGDYIVPAAGPNDSITGIVVAADAITFAQHRSAVGRVRRILDDGRAEISVKGF